MTADRSVILVTGSSGQVGFELVRELAPLGIVVAPPRSELDLARPESIRVAVRRICPTVIVNAAAYTAVDRAEGDRDACFAVNAEAPRILAEEASRGGAALIHYSTDYVFDGTAIVPYVETDEPAPLNVYGSSKLAGEQAIAAVGGAWLVLRTSWVYGARGQNFLTTILRSSREKEELRVVDDQIGAPTWSRSVAASTARLLGVADSPDGMVSGVAAASGLYHLSSSGQTSWYEFARAILANDRAGGERRFKALIPIPTAKYPTPAVRPRWSVLSNEKLSSRFGIEIPSWESELELAMGHPADPRRLASDGVHRGRRESV